jgi:hypothetical protein
MTGGSGPRGNERRGSDPSAWVTAGVAAGFALLALSLTWLGPGGLMFWSGIGFVVLAMVLGWAVRGRGISLGWAANTFITALIVWFIVASVYLLVALSNLEMD